MRAGVQGLPCLEALMRRAVSSEGCGARPQADLVKDNGARYFVDHLAGGEAAEWAPSRAQALPRPLTDPHLAPHTRCQRHAGPISRASYQHLAVLFIIAVDPAGHVRECSNRLKRSMHARRRLSCWR